MSRTTNLSYPISLRSHPAKRPKTEIFKCATSLYINTAFLDFCKKKWKSVVSPAINGFSSEVLIQALTVRWMRFALMQNGRSGQCYSMNNPSEWLPHCAFKRYCGSKKIVEEKVVNKIFQHSKAAHHSALLYIAIAQAYLKLENTVMIIALASAVQKQSRKYCILVACFDYFGFNYFGVGFNTRGGVACFWKTLLRGRRLDKIQNANFNRQNNSRQLRA